MLPNLYALERLSTADLKLLYPSDNLYKKDYTLALHLTECLLVEDMEWEGDDAIGETAFWLKVLSSPKQEEYQLQKLQFKRDVYDRWSEKHSIKLLKMKWKPGASQVAVNPVNSTHGLAEEMTLADSGLQANCETLRLEEHFTESLLIGGSEEASTGVETMAPHRKRTEELTEETGEKTSNSEELLNIYKCQHCSFSAKSPHTVSSHKFSLHTDIYTVACKEDGCNYRCKRRWMLNRHLRTRHSNERNFQCSACGFAAKTSVEIKRHIENKHDNLRWKCKLCDFDCPISAMSSRYMHMAQVHDDKSNVLQCESCDYMVVGKLSLQSHINTHHAFAVKYRCKNGSCHFWSFSKVTCQLHEEQCNRSGNLQPRQRRSFNGGQRRVYRFWCSDCGLFFCRKHTIGLHIKRIHDGKATAIPTNSTKPGVLSFNCLVCRLVSADKRAIDEHMQIVHQGEGEIQAVYTEDSSYVPTTYRCDQCDMVTNTLCGLKSHLRANHNIQFYHCDQCDFVTSAKGSFTRHKNDKHSSIS